MANLVNLEGVSHGFGTRILLDSVSLGLSAGEVIGVVGRNGDGKTTLLRILTGELEPDSGRVTVATNSSIGVLTQATIGDDAQTIRDWIVDGEPDHVWAADADKRAVVEALVADLDLDRRLDTLSGGERRRVGLVAVLLGHHDLVVLDEPTNHLDVEAIAFLATHLQARTRAGLAMLVVSHDRWFLDAICTRIWEVHDGVVDAYEGGYAAYVLARVERQRQAAANESRRRNLARKELAWLRRGAPARTSKPKFRIDAANVLIADEPEPRDKLALQQFAVTRLGKDVFDLINVQYAVDDRTLLDRLTWSIGPGDRIGLVGVNGAGKTTLLDLLSGDRSPQGGKVKRGKTLRLGYLSQTVGELDDEDRVLESVKRLKEETKLATGREASASSLLEEFGFTGDKLVARIGDLSGGERRRLQFLRLLLAEPNVLILDEPTNDLDIDTLTVIEDYLDRWPGTLIVVSHDRYFLERITDYTYALLGDGSCVLLPGGVDEYLDRRARSKAAAGSRPGGAAVEASRSDAAAERQRKKDLARIEGQLEKVAAEIERLHATMAEAATDFARLAELDAQLRDAEARHERLEEAWLETAD
ncbi:MULTISPECIES: ABC-F family ATP-binding cassette domain-containing protein [Tessaracoccus]|uniref:ABC-F family ATP-binding cassette domain-containing protein n=1 Tax=Tessaracoccus TaxID=72763 RepID=UPI0009C37EF7|nr:MULTISPECIES: ABC-F family ATP-binding cassette domain-containing protein [Tessaracoccus]AQX16639.1 glycerophosphodiester phosphodiesterase [Tessaracoccus sp. T2.5-30]VEP41350.1 Energy-dependent translational throttle protein EttA [Tessaracoccus lapidicaptus]